MYKTITLQYIAIFLEGLKYFILLRKYDFFFREFRMKVFGLKFDDCSEISFWPYFDLYRSFGGTLRRNVITAEFFYRKWDFWVTILTIILFFFANISMHTKISNAKMPFSPKTARVWAKILGNHWGFVLWKKNIFPIHWSCPKYMKKLLFMNNNWEICLIILSDLTRHSQMALNILIFSSLSHWEFRWPLRTPSDNNFLYFNFFQKVTNIFCHKFFVIYLLSVVSHYFIYSFTIAVDGSESF